MCSQAIIIPITIANLINIESASSRWLPSSSSARSLPSSALGDWTNILPLPPPSSDYALIIPHQHPIRLSLSSCLPISLSWSSSSTPNQTLIIIMSSNFTISIIIINAQSIVIILSAYQHYPHCYYNHHHCILWTSSSYPITSPLQWYFCPLAPLQSTIVINPSLSMSRPLITILSKHFKCTPYFPIWHWKL